MLPTSCLDILDSDSSATDGFYDIDPDGLGGSDPVMVFCDMTNGGWSVVSVETFEDGTATGWSDDRVDTMSTCATAYGSMLGGYGLWGAGASSQKTFDLLGIAHTEARVELDFVVLDSWDTEEAIVDVDGVEVYRQAFSHGAAPSDVCGAGYNDHGPQAVAETVAHTGTMLTVTATTTLSQSALDESFGLQNVRISLK